MTQAQRAIGRGALWSAILHIGGVLLLGGSLGYAVLTLQAYEDRYGPLDSDRPIPTITASEAPPADNVSVTAPEPAVPTMREPAPAAPDAALTAQIGELTSSLQDARGKLTDTESRNAALQGRVAELEQQVAAQGGSATTAAAAVAQCRAEMTELRNSYNVEARRRAQENSELRRQLRVCMAEEDDPAPIL